MEKKKSTLHTNPRWTGWQALLPSTKKTLSQSIEKKKIWQNLEWHSQKSQVRPHNAVCLLFKVWQKGTFVLSKALTFLSTRSIHINHRRVSLIYEIYHLSLCSHQPLIFNSHIVLKNYKAEFSSQSNPEVIWRDIDSELLNSLFIRNMSYHLSNVSANGHL